MTTAFFDTNIIVYALTTDDPRAARARSLVDRGGRISVQSLNEFTNVARRKLRWAWDDIEDALAELLEVFDPVLVVDYAVHRRGIEIAKRYGLSIYDSMIVATAIIAGCDQLYSEDMHHGLVIDGQLRIVNPFRDA